MMDDANAPGLLSLPYLGCCSIDDPLYRRSRQFVQSEANPYFFRGTAAEGVGGPHVGLNMIWPMSIIMRALTSTDDAEIRQCLRWLRNTTAGTGFMHESFQKDDPQVFTRAWFAWANTLFGELTVRLASERPQSSVVTGAEGEMPTAWWSAAGAAKLVSSGRRLIATTVSGQPGNRACGRRTLVKAALCRSSTLAPASATHISQKAREIPRISCAQLWIG